MTEISPAFEETYRIYLERIAKLEFKSLEKNLAVSVKEDEVIVPFFGKPYHVSAKGIVGPSGKKPSLEICVVLSNYLILCQDFYLICDEWVSYRDFKNSGPLTVFYANAVEQPLARQFSGKLSELEKACGAYGGIPSSIEISYELSMIFYSLPKVPMLLLYNDADEEFPAHCSLLFERHAEKYLDAESLAILGMILSSYLRRDL
ncbi:MAG: DUF3786 domain-containing protein [Desulfobacterales bacterium]|nr:MAG: DUF3786 domain-containing protein [Desulfobacterales bacterium]